MFYALLAICLMALDHRGRYVDALRAAAGRVIEPAFIAVDLPFIAAENLADRMAAQQTLRARVEALETELLEARARLGTLDDLALENVRLRGLLDTARRLEHEFISAEVAGIDLDPIARRLMLRRGRDRGVTRGMPVIDADGVVGQVEQVRARTATVIMITNPDHALPVQVLPVGERTIAYGSGLPEALRLTDLPMNTGIEVGDLVVTSGVGGRFPAGLPVARITALERDPGKLFARATAVPLAAMDRNRNVLLLQPVPARSAAAAEAGDDPSQPGAGSP